VQQVAGKKEHASRSIHHAASITQHPFRRIHYVGSIT